MATNFVTTNLTDWTNADPQKALEYVILSGNGMKDYFTIEGGVKYSTKIPYFNNADVDISTGNIAGYNTGSGTTTAIDVTLENKQLKIFENYTKEILNRTIMNGLQKPGTDPNDLPAQDIILALKGKALRLANEKLLWTDASVKIPKGGVIQQLTDASTWITAGFTSVAFTSLTDASVLSYVKKAKDVMVSNFPQFVTEEMVLAMSPENFQAYNAALYGLSGAINNQTVGADGKPILSTRVPGTNITAVGFDGLTTSNRLILSHPSNIIVVVDLVGEDEILEFIYNPYARQFELAVNYKLGVKMVDATKVVMSA